MPKAKTMKSGGKGGNGFAGGGKNTGFVATPMATPKKTFKK